MFSLVKLQVRKHVYFKRDSIWLPDVVAAEKYQHDLISTLFLSYSLNTRKKYNN